MRTIFFAATAILMTAGVAAAQTPQPATSEPVPAAGSATAANGSAPNFAVNMPVPDVTYPRVWGTADYMLMWYTPMRTPPLIQAVPTAFTSSTNPAFTSTFFPENNRVNFGSFNGLRGYIGAGGEKWAGEVGGFVLERGTETGSLFNNGIPVAVGQGYIAAGSGVPTTLYASLAGQYSGGVAAVAESKLWGVEGYVRRAWYSLFADATDLIIGGRYLDLQESLAISAPSFFPDGGVINVQDLIRTRNMFYGGQLGFNGRLGGFDRGLGIDFTTKGAIGGVAQRVELVGYNTFVTAGVPDTQPGGLYARGANLGNFSRNKIAYLQDVDFRLTYNFNRYVQAYFGYYLIYLSSVMRPGDAIDPVVNDNIRFVAAPTPSNANRPAFAWRAEELVMQGMTFGFRVQY
jgi:hypothetical protein